MAPLRDSPPCLAPRLDPGLTLGHRHALLTRRLGVTPRRSIHPSQSIPDLDLHRNEPRHRQPDRVLQVQVRGRGSVDAKRNFCNMILPTLSLVDLRSGPRGSNATLRRLMLLFMQSLSLLRYPRCPWCPSRERRRGSGVRKMRKSHASSSEHVSLATSMRRKKIILNALVIR